MAFGAIVVIISIAALLGIGLSAVLPVLDAPDEVYHWQRAVQISHGQFFAGRQGGQTGYGGEIDSAALGFARWANQHFERSSPFSLSEARGAAAEVAKAPGKSAASFPSTASFAPLAYLPQAAGIAAARAAGGNVFAQLLAGRVANLLAYLSLIAAAVWLVPFGQRTLLALALTAPTLHLAASVSGDPSNFALPVLLFAACLRLRHNGSTELTSSGRFGLALLMISLALLKPIYLLLAAIALLVPERCFGGRRAKVVFLAWTFGIALLLSIAWNATYPFVPGRYWGTGADPKAVLLGILGDPLAAATYFMNSLKVQMPLMWLDAWGRFGGYPPPFMVNAPQALSWGGLAALLALSIAETQGRRDLRAALLMMLLAAAFSVAIFLAFWAAFSPPGSAVIRGVQGRYFLPAFLLVAWALAAAAPAGGALARLRSPLLVLALSLQAAALVYGVADFRFYWSN